MIINNILFKDNGKESILSADVHLSRFRTKRLFFSVESRYKDFIFADASPFLAAVLMRSVKSVESLDILGNVSEKLYENIVKIIDTIDKLKIIKKKKEIAISVGGSRPDVKTAHSGIGCFFSGGVDSFYTLLKNNYENREKITHLIFVHGFDIPMWNTKLFEIVNSRMQKVAEHFGIELICVKTNIREISDAHVEWIMAHGGAVAAVALFLRRGLSKVYIASSNSWDQLEANGTHPYLDYLWGTENLEIVHDGNESNRTEKIKKYIATSEIALQNLRVCFNNYGNVYNCGKCEKCLRTMIELRASGVLNRTKRNFRDNLETKNILLLENNPTVQKHFGASLKELEQNEGDQELKNAIKEMLSGKNNIPLIKKILRYLSNIDKKYTKGRFFLYAWQIKKRMSSLL